MSSSWSAVRRPPAGAALVVLGLALAGLAALSKATGLLGGVLLAGREALPQLADPARRRAAVRVLMAAAP